MAWEKRGNGNSYYYRKRRVNGRVVSEYVGTGELAAIRARLDSLKRALRLQQQAERRAARAKLDELDVQVAELDSVVQALARASLLAAGCRTHKGQWRSRRVK